MPRPLSDPQLTLLAKGLGANPRRIKRFMNLLAMNLGLAAIARSSRAVPTWLIPVEGKASDEDERKFTWYLKALLVSYRYPGASAVMMRDAELLKRLHVIAGDYRRNRKNQPLEARKLLKSKCDAELPVIRALGDTEDFWRLLSLSPSLQDNPALIKEIVGWFRQGTLPIADENDDWD